MADWWSTKLFGWIYFAGHHFITYAKEDQSVQIPLLITLILGFELGPVLIWAPLPLPIKTVKTMPNPLGKELDCPVAVMVIPLLNAVGESLTTFALSMKIRGSPFKRILKLKIMGRKAFYYTQK